MSIDPRTPVLVGGGQTCEHEGGVEPVDLIASAARAAAEQAGSTRLLELVDTIRVVGMLSWRYRDPGALVAQRIGARVRHSGYSGNGGSTPQVFVNRAARDISEGRCDIVLIGGAEAWRTRTRLRAQGLRPDWSHQPDTTPPAEVLVADVPMDDHAERRIELDRPAYVYPMFEQALRIADQRNVGEHTQKLGELWSRFSAVAATNPHAWSPRLYPPSEIVSPSVDNRWIATPYPKLLNSNNMVDQGAALLMCSAGTAARLGIPQSHWVFPRAGTEASDTSAIAQRGALHRSPAIRLAGQAALRLAEVELEDIDHIDVYSCFPSAVQIAARELGLADDDPARPLTITGGLTFAGGPWNNYSTHAIATMLTRLRQTPGSLGLVTANSGYLTKHAIGIYATTPPTSGFSFADVQAAVDREPKTESLACYQGSASLEAWTVVFDRNGAAEKAFVAARTPAGARVLAVTRMSDDLAVLATAESPGLRVDIDSDGSCRLH